MNQYFPDAKTEEGLPDDPMANLLRRLDAGDTSAQEEIDGIYREVSRRNWIEGIPPLFANSTLDNWESKTPAHRGVLKNVCDKIRSIRDGKDNKGFILSGGVGSGKTHLAVGILRALASGANSGAVIKVVKLAPMVAKQVEHSQSDYHLSDRLPFDGDVIDAAEHRSVVVLDDIGAEMERANLMDRIFQIIDSRYEHGRMTILTTNLIWTPEEPAAGSKVGMCFWHRYGERVVSRLNACCDPFMTPDGDWRSP